MRDDSFRVTYLLSRFWTHIPGYGERAKCPICGKYDMLNHIVTECDLMERNTVWKQANTLWKWRYSTILPTSEEAVLGAGLVSFIQEDGKPDVAKNHLYQILMTKLTHLIWVLRCKHQIANGDNPHNYHTANTVQR